MTRSTDAPVRDAPLASPPPFAGEGEVRRFGGRGDVRGAAHTAAETPPGRGTLRRGRASTPVAAALVLLAAAAGCEAPPEPPISRSEFVEANVALRMVPDTAAAADSLRTAALDSVGVTADELDGWLAATRDTEVLAETWREIGDSLLARRQREEEPAVSPDNRAAEGDGEPDAPPVERRPPVVSDPEAGADLAPPPPGSLDDVAPAGSDKPPVGDKRPR